MQSERSVLILQVAVVSTQSARRCPAIRVKLLQKCDSPVSKLGALRSSLRSRNRLTQGCPRVRALENSKCSIDFQTINKTRRHWLSRCSQVVCASHVGLRRSSRACWACCFDLAENVQDDDAADVKKTNEHHSLGTEFHALGVLREESELVALAVSAALALRKGSSLVGWFAARNSTLASALFCWGVHGGKLLSGRFICVV